MEEGINDVLSIVDSIQWGVKCTFALFIALLVGLLLACMVDISNCISFQAMIF